MTKSLRQSASYSQLNDLPIAHIATLAQRAKENAPITLRLPDGFEQAPPVLAMGSRVRSAFCMLQTGKAVLSQQLGDLRSAIALKTYQRTLDLYLSLLTHSPVAIAIEQHPEYPAAQFGKELAHQLNGWVDQSLPLHDIQYHHAHVAACMVDNQIPLNTEPVLGIALGGLGYGEDRTLWGGEFLLADYCQLQRVGTFKPVALLGGEQAIYQPWRNTYAHLISAFDWEDLQTVYGQLEVLQFLDRQPRLLLNQLLFNSMNAPAASSVDRLWDAVAAAVGIRCETADYDGQGAIELAALVDAEQIQREGQPYPFEIRSLHRGALNPPIPYIESRSMWHSLLEDLFQGASARRVATRFHLGLVDAITQMVMQLQSQHPFRQVALTGHSFRDSILAHQVTERLQAQGLTVLTHQQIPANESGLSVGQAAIAAARMLNA
ncbi:Kae1-like domain-containing protein [Egbenema bharatensis]|uniref:Kae1-like domain-containing protein n=1 Tax=Egbenema bharatensis TaxID=3463334 RepID=UPI003A8ADFF9